MAGNNRSAAPNSEWTKFKLECAQQVGHSQYAKENNDHYKGDLPSRINGEQGGPIGGQMVKRMIEMAKTQIPQS